MIASSGKGLGVCSKALPHDFDGDGPKIASIKGFLQAAQFVQNAANSPNVSLAIIGAALQARLMRQIQCLMVHKQGMASPGKALWRCICRCLVPWSAEGKVAPRRLSFQLIHKLLPSESLETCESRAISSISFLELYPLGSLMKENMNVG